MDTELLRTFLEVQRMRSFTRAAENLSLTPSAVSARIRQLEGAVRRSLFKRNSQRVQLTPAGERLMRHALGIVDAWDRAEKHVALDDRAPVTVAGVASFWDIFLQDWLHRVRCEMPEVVPWVEVSGAARIAEKLEHGELHLGFLYSPPQIADLIVREAAALELVLVSSRPAADPEEALSTDYILVDWGTLFSGQHNRHFPHRPLASARSNSARLALGLIRRCGGSAYLPRALVEADLANGALHLVPGAPVFRMRAYAVHVARGERRDLVERMLALL
jgi:DNA-binding transcriptional LysR family regulator